MDKLKVFGLGNHGFVGAAVLRALGEPPHVRQARVLIVAPNKAAAIEVAERCRSAEARVALPSKSDPEFRLATGRDVDALRAAGMCDEPGILVLPLTSWRSPVVRVDADGVRRVGTLDGDRLVTNDRKED